MTTAGTVKPSPNPDQSAVDPKVFEGPWLRPGDLDLSVYIGRGRDELFEAFQDALAAAGLRGITLKSPDWREPAVVSCEVWISAERQFTTRRCKAVVELQPRPHRNCCLAIVGTLETGGRSRTGNPWLFEAPSRPLNWVSLANETVSAMVDRSRPIPELYRWRLSRIFDFGRKPDEIRAFAKDVGGMAVFIIMMLGIIPTVGPILVVIGMASLGLRHLSLLANNSVRVIDSGRLSRLPRVLRFVDTWHVVLPGLGGRAHDVLKTLTQVEDESWRPPGVTWTTERIWQASVDGVEVRDQIVHTMGRAIVFVQVTPYGDDLYIGWDSHLNRGYWAEANVAEGRDEGGKRIRVTQTVPAEAQLTNFDLADVNTLAENIHRSLVGQVRRLVAENHIDQEFDFEVNRGRRADLLGEERSEKASRVRRLS